MMRGERGLSRRDAIRAMAAGAAGAAGAAATMLAPTSLLAAPRQEPLLTKAIPSSGERLAVVGLGTWITFNVGNDAALRAECAEVMRAFFAAGGQVIDSSPMYGSSQSVIGHGLRTLGRPGGLFAADKVWISPAVRGPSQMEESRRAWSVPRFDLLQVHNLLAWEDHLETLFEMKRASRVRYVGITTSEGRRHEEFERVMRTQPIDFAQVTYNVLDREVEQRILPLARERGIAVLANRPFRQGDLLREVERHPLPAWASEAGASSWPRLLLKFIVSHPAVTCAIPATSQVAHVRENMSAATGILPDESLRRRIAAYVEGL